jgi:hypothetical protein
MNRRPLKTIAAEIRTKLKREAVDVIEIGALLAEAREQLKHGEWLPWIEAEFDLSARTATRYLNVHDFARAQPKSAKMSDLKLDASALVTLAESDWKGVDKQAVKEVLQKAKTEWISNRSAQNQINARRPLPAPPPPSDDKGPDAELPDEATGEGEPPPDEAPYEEEPSPDDDRPPPTPPPGLTPRQVSQLRQFEEAARTLLGLAAKPSREFAAADMVGFDLETIADFLRQVAKEKAKAGEAADQPQAIH